MIVLGWHGGIRREFEDMEPGWSTHDGAAALLADGELVAACEEERINRVKHSNYFPTGAIAECLELAGIGWDEVDLVAMNFANRTERIYPCDRGLPSVDLFLTEPARRSFTVPEAVEELFRRAFGAEVGDRLYFCHHHLAHLWSAWSCAGVEEALLVSLDGSGDCLSGMVGIGFEGGCRPIREFPVAHSLGDFYSDLIRLLGYRRFDEYKVMGLAPRGDAARFRDLLGQMYRLRPDGGYELIGRRDRWELLYEAGILAGARRSGESLSDVHCDFAAALQGALETIVLHLLAHHRDELGQRHLCLAGGVAHNSSLNGRILREGGFDSVFVQPAAHDAGGALGAALAAETDLGGGARPRRLRHVFLGSELGATDAIEVRLDAWGEALKREAVADVASYAAERIAAGDVLGWVQGRAEFGPRALGHRSLLADPRDPSNVARINGMIKNREHYRPFAPSVLEERLGEIVDLPRTEADYSFMTYVLPVKPSARAMLGAVTHVDGTARVQSVSREVDDLYWSLIRHFDRITGVPVLLNTSLNNHAEPIVNSVDDAVSLLLTSPIDLLVVGEHVVERRHPVGAASIGAGLCPALPASRKLVRRAPAREPDGGTGLAVEATASSHFLPGPRPLSALTYEVLTAADGALTAGAICSDLGMTEVECGAVAEELHALWGERAISMRPPR